LVTFRRKLIGCREPKYSGPDDDNFSVLLHFLFVMMNLNFKRKYRSRSANVRTIRLLIKYGMWTPRYQIPTQTPAPGITDTS
jgi:hypothetical protein